MKKFIGISDHSLIYVYRKLSLASFSTGLGLGLGLELRLGLGLAMVGKLGNISIHSLQSCIVYLKCCLCSLNGAL